MSASSDLDLRITADPAEVPGLLDRIEAYADAMGLPLRVAHRLGVVCEELAANVAEHGAGPGGGASAIAVALRRRGSAVHVVFEDDGRPFDPLGAALPDTAAPLDARAPGGLGLHLVRTFAREMRIDDEVLGFRREGHHAFLLGGPAARALRIERAGRPAGYAYISAEGHVGPLAVVPGADAKGVVSAALRCALERQPQQLSMMVPGKADSILAALPELGFRIEEPFLLLSARPFGDWRHYLPSNPGFM